MYIARDKNGNLYVYSGKPTKNINTGCWHAAELDALMYLETYEFLNVKWEDEEPTEVELILKKTDV